MYLSRASLSRDLRATTLLPTAWTLHHCLQTFHQARRTLRKTALQGPQMIAVSRLVYDLVSKLN